MPPLSGIVNARATNMSNVASPAAKTPVAQADMRTRRTSAKSVAGGAPGQ